MKNILFVCSRNQWRSPTAERIFRDYPGIKVKSAGTSPKAKKKVSAKDISWADIIYVMESKHKKILKANFPPHVALKEIIVLDIPDEYQYMDLELIDILKTCISE